jgi:hypothetical protein
MATAAETRTPVHLWIVGGLALIWNCLGAYDYLMTRTHNMAYLAKAMPGVDPNVGLAWIEGMPMYAQIGWGLGVWGGLLGAILLLMRSRFAVWAFAASLLGVLLCIGYQLALAPPLPGQTSTMKLFGYIIIALAAFLLWYSWAADKKGLLR